MEILFKINNCFNPLLKIKLYLYIVDPINQSPEGPFTDSANLLSEEDLPSRTGASVSAQFTNFF